MTDINAIRDAALEEAKDIAKVIELHLRNCDKEKIR